MFTPQSSFYEIGLYHETEPKKLEVYMKRFKQYLKWFKETNPPKKADAVVANP